MLSDVDLTVLDRCFDPLTLARARTYVSRGAVLEADWNAGGDRVSGRVQGSRIIPYEVVVDLTRIRGGRLMAVDGECTCPVGADCKHAAALLLSTLRGSTTSRPASRRAVKPDIRRTPERSAPAGPAWDRVLGAVLDAAGEPAAGERPCDAGVALQFELVSRVRRAPDRGAVRQLTPVAAPTACVQLRPVVPGAAAGSWVRNGVSWRDLDYLGRQWSRYKASAQQVALLRELRALGGLESSLSYSSYAPEQVWLDRLASRRIWDVLAEAEDLGIPLVGVGRPASRVTVHRTCAEVVLDASAPAGAGGITLRPLLRAGAVAIPFPRPNSLLVGTPAHGVAWWDEPSGASGQPPLSFAALPADFVTTSKALFDGKPLFVPHADEERFLAEARPRLRRRVRVESSDGTVELAALPEESALLTLRHREGHRLDVEWSTAVPGTGWRSPLRDSDWRPDRGPVGESLAVALGTVLRHAAGATLAPAGDRFQPTSSLEGIAAVRFLSDVLPEIETVPGLVVEEVGERPDFREATEAPTLALRASGEDGTDWFDLAVEVRLGTEVVPFAQLFVALAGGETHLLLPSGVYFSLDREELRELARLIAEARALHDTEGDRIRVTRYQASLWEDFERLGVSTAQSADWERSVRALAGAGDRAELPQPAALQAVLRPYQHVGFTWLTYLYELGLGGVLADDMGLGKTLQILALVSHVRERGLSEDPFLVVAPTSVVGTWAAECRKFAPGLVVETVSATSVRRGETLFDLSSRADVVVTSYALFRLEYDQYEKLEWAGLVLDEAQFVKNPHSHAWRRAKTFPVSFKVALTGTPMENHLGELWALLSITAPGLFGSAERFAEYYRLPIERRADEERLALLRRRIRPLLLRRAKEQVAADLPPKREQVIELDLAPRHRKLYQTYLQRERQKVLGLIDDVQKNRFEILKSLTFLRQACLDVALVDPTRGRVPSTKLDALMEMLDGIVADGHRVLVFSQFTRFLTMARDRLKAAGIPHCYLDGRTRDRAGVLDTFRAGEMPVFLISLKAGGFGLNLTEADYCVLLDPWWNPAVEAQAVDRVHRIGQTKNVMVYRLVAKETIEEKVMALKARKSALAASVLDGGGFESGALSAADIRALLD